MHYRYLVTPYLLLIDIDLNTTNRYGFLNVYLAYNSLLCHLKLYAVSMQFGGARHHRIDTKQMSHSEFQLPFRYLFEQSLVSIRSSFDAPMFTGINKMTKNLENDSWISAAHSTKISFTSSRHWRINCQLAIINLKYKYIHSTTSICISIHIYILTQIYTNKANLSTYTFSHRYIKTKLQHKHIQVPEYKNKSLPR